MEHWSRRFGMRTNLLRTEDGHGDKVSFLELFFDLVFVFAITQISHTFVYSINGGKALEGVLESTVVVLAVWWVWVYTAWVTNWLDPDKGAVRWMLIALMVLGLVMSTSIPEAFGDRAWLFVGAYVTMQIGRALFTISSMIRFEPANALNVTRLTIWFGVSAIFWFAGAAAEDPWWRLALWGVAIVIEYLGPVSRYWVPGLRSSYIGGIPIRGAHIAERAGLFVIIAIGESIIVTGTSFTTNPISAASTFAFLGSVTGSILLWLLYFSRAEAGGSHFIRRHDHPSLVAANSYTYLHVVLVGGIVLVAVSDELVLAHPTEPARLLTIALVYGAPIVYLVGNLIFKRSIGAPWLKSHLVGTAVLVVLGAISLTQIVSLTALAHMWIANTVLVGVVVGEEIDFRAERRRRRAARASAAAS